MTSIKELNSRSSFHEDCVPQLSHSCFQMPLDTISTIDALTLSSASTQLVTLPIYDASRAIPISVPLTRPRNPGSLLLHLYKNFIRRE